MNTMYDYVVLHLAPDPMRGEVLNVGVAVFRPGMQPDVRFLAPLSKLQAVGHDWDRKRAKRWTEWVHSLLADTASSELGIDRLARLGLCARVAAGSFTADGDAAYEREIQDVRNVYVRPGGQHDVPTRQPRRQRLVTELRQHFVKRQVMGKTADDLQEHLVVANVEIPSHPDLRADFVYKNGVYRITQTLDYRVSPAAAHQKVQEACTKSMAAELARSAWGPETMKLAVVNVPEAVADVADSHLDLLLAQGFQVFHATDASDLARYFTLAEPPSAQAVLN